METIILRTKDGLETTVQNKLGLYADNYTTIIKKADNFCIETPDGEFIHNLKRRWYRYKGHKIDGVRIFDEIDHF